MVIGKIQAPSGTHLARYYVLLYKIISVWISVSVSVRVNKP